MNIREQLLKEHTRVNALKIANYACLSKKNFKALMICFLDEEYWVGQRAAWSVSWAAQKQPQMITPFIKDLLAQLQRKDVHDAVIRNSVRVLEQIDIPEMAKFTKTHASKLGFSSFRQPELAKFAPTLTIPGYKLFNFLLLIYSPGSYVFFIHPFTEVNPKAAEDSVNFALNRAVTTTEKSDQNLTGVFYIE